MSAVAHPSPTVLSDYSTGRASEAEASEIARHLEECVTCCARMDTLPPRKVEKVLKSVFSSRRRTRDLPSIPGYDVLCELGHGGMGVVFKAFSQNLKCEVAIKVLDLALAADPLVRERFLQAEVYTAALLNHPGIVRVIATGTVDGVPYAVMDYVEGRTLAQMVKEDGPLPVEVARHIAAKVACALQYLHERKIPHRDIKPQNIMVSNNGDVKILDLGLARVTERSAPTGRSGPGVNLTELGAILGTIRYMAPEQSTSPRVDSRADIYALGATLYYLLTGVVPFPELDGIDLITAHREKDPEPVSKLRAGVPSWLLKVLSKMMAKKPSDRYQTPAEVEAALNRTGGGRILPPRRAALAALAALVALGGSCATLQAWPFDRVRGPNEVLTTDAFEAYERGDYQAAKQKAEECIRDFRGDAERRQKELAAQQAKQPPVGKVSRSLLEWVRGEGPAEILQEGPLNDVATSYWLLGRCSEKFGQIAEARAAYEQGRMLSYARCWDPKTKLLWSPAVKCGDDLDNLNAAHR